MREAHGAAAALLLPAAAAASSGGAAAAPIPGAPAPASGAAGPDAEVLAFGLGGLAATDEEAARLRLLDLGRHPHARCLDGSAAGFFLRPASAPENASRWVIFLQGGGECVTQETCTARTQTWYGSSKYWTPNATLIHYQFADPEWNPDFFSWNQVFIPYCSGDIWLGKSTAATARTWGMRFAGHHIVAAVLRELLAGGGLAAATTVLWGGASAGGIGAIAHVDYAQAQIPHARVLGAPVGGYYFSNDAPYTSASPPAIPYTPWTTDAVSTYWTLWGDGEGFFVPEACAAAKAEHPWHCLFAAVSYPHVAAPLFVIQAQTDKVVMPLHDGLPRVWKDEQTCANDVSNCPAAVLQYMAQWAGNISTALAPLRAGAGAKQRDGLFHPACLEHTGFTTAGPLVHGASYVAALGDWVFGRPPPPAGAGRWVYVDDCDGVMCGMCSPGERAALANAQANARATASVEFWSVTAAGCATALLLVATAAVLLRQRAPVAAWGFPGHSPLSPLSPTRRWLSGRPVERAAAMRRCASAPSVYTALLDQGGAQDGYDAV